MYQERLFNQSLFQLVKRGLVLRRQSPVFVLERQHCQRLSDDGEPLYKWSEVNRKTQKWMHLVDVRGLWKVEDTP